MDHRYLLLVLPVLSLTLGNSKTAKPVVASERPCTHYYHSLLKKNVYTQVDEEPDFPGNVVDYTRFLTKHLHLPEEIANGEEEPHPIIMTFIVDTTGRLLQPRIKGKTDTATYTSFEKAYLKTLPNMPPWKAARCNGKKVVAEITRPMIICMKLEREG